MEIVDYVHHNYIVLDCWKSIIFFLIELQSHTNNCIDFEFLPPSSDTHHFNTIHTVWWNCQTSFTLAHEKINNISVMIKISQWWLKWSGRELWFLSRASWSSRGSRAEFNVTNRSSHNCFNDGVYKFKSGMCPCD